MVESNFQLKGSFLVKDGAARSTTDNYCNKKLCFVATDKVFLMKLLLELSTLEFCYFVKLTAEPRDGMYLGRCFFTTDDYIGSYWAKFKAHPKVMCNIQDDDFADSYREKVVGYKS